ncbi:hypothetical protein B0H15DRAFT_773995 [Mycena belliarum]|uniref:Uncharacterized protein n=1 Tax=Mycena belliarum TaxID=1033014 RepID=A0AAD6UF76_9AGAR|nr:hypothetical protein B0H15DRAFT_773995 [Mycena belliae]
MGQEAAAAIARNNETLSIVCTGQTEGTEGGSAGAQSEEHENSDAPQPDKTDWPRWMAEEYELLSSATPDSDWLNAISSWTSLERAYGFKTSTIGLPKTARPSEVSQWIKFGRSTRRETQVTSVEKLEAAWWKWWAFLSPEWRMMDQEGRPVTGEGSGEWGILAHPGANGIAMVLLPLLWWRKAEKTGGASESWLRAVHDIAWVLKGLLSAATSKKYVPFSRNDMH